MFTRKFLKKKWTHKSLPTAWDLIVIFFKSKSNSTQPSLRYLRNTSELFQNLCFPNMFVLWPLKNHSKNNLSNQKQNILDICEHQLWSYEFHSMWVNLMNIYRALSKRNILNKIWPSHMLHCWLYLGYMRRQSYDLIKNIILSMWV